MTIKILMTIWMLVFLTTVYGSSSRIEKSKNSRDQKRLARSNDRNLSKNTPLRILVGFKCYAKAPEGTKRKTKAFDTEQQCRVAAAEKRKNARIKKGRKLKRGSRQNNGQPPKDNVYIYTGDEANICEEIEEKVLREKYPQTPFYSSYGTCLRLYGHTVGALVYYPGKTSCVKVLLGILQEDNKKKPEAKRKPSYRREDDCIRKHFNKPEKEEEVDYFDPRYDMCKKGSIETIKKYNLTYYNSNDACQAAHAPKYYHIYKYNISCQKTHITEAELRQNKDVEFFYDLQSCEQSYKRLKPHKPAPKQQTAPSKYRFDDGTVVDVCKYADTDICLSKKDIIQQIENIVIRHVPLIIDLQKAWALYHRFGAYTLPELTKLYSDVMDKLGNGSLQDKAAMGAAMALMEVVAKNGEPCEFLLTEIPIRNNIFTPIQKACSEFK